MRGPDRPAGHVERPSGVASESPGSSWIRWPRRSPHRRDECPQGGERDQRAGRLLDLERAVQQGRGRGQGEPVTAPISPSTEAEEASTRAGDQGDPEQDEHEDVEGIHRVRQRSDAAIAASSTSQRRAGSRAPRGRSGLLLPHQVVASPGMTTSRAPGTDAAICSPMRRGRRDRAGPTRRGSAPRWLGASAPVLRKLGRCPGHADRPRANQVAQQDREDRGRVHGNVRRDR